MKILNLAGYCFERVEIAFGKRVPGVVVVPPGGEVERNVELPRLPDQIDMAKMREKIWFSSPGSIRGTSRAGRAARIRGCYRLTGKNRSDTPGSAPLSPSGD